MNAGELIYHRPESENRSDTALIFEDEHIAYGELLEQTQNLSHALTGLGITPGAKVALLILNRPENLISYFAVLLAGAVAVPINIQLKADEIHYILEDSGATALIFSAPLYQNLKCIGKYISKLELVQIGDKSLAQSHSFSGLVARPAGLFKATAADAETVAHIIYTTGTTGKPKGVLISHSSLSWMIKSTITEWEMLPHEKIIMPLPLYHVYGLVCSIAMLAAGSTNILLEKFKVQDVLTTIKRYRPAGFMGVPTMYTMLLNHGSDPSMDMSFLKYCASGGSSLPADVLHSFTAKFKAKIIEGYGLSESTLSVAKNPIHGQQKPGSVGLPFPGVQIKIVDDKANELPPNVTGEITVKGPNVMQGYLNNPQATQATLRNGWLYTGDLGYRDSEGYLFIVGRKTEMYIRGGENVYPREIEEVLYNHPAVSECAVIGVRDDVYGHVGKAFITLKPGLHLSTEEISVFCQQHLAKYKIPAHFAFIETFPKTATGKILKRKLSPNF